MKHGEVRAPFPYYGGKAHYASTVWSRFGVVDRYIEPFFGSGAVLLANPDPAGMEIVCDTNGFITNFWRAIIHDPERTAEYACYPTFHHDLTARHAWLRKWGAENEKLLEDPEFYDPRVAGWWVWGKSIWIGSGWCEFERQKDVIPTIQTQKGGRGVSVQRVFDKRPEVKPSSGGGRGVSMQRKIDSVPYVNNQGGGMGVSKQRKNFQSAHCQEIYNWFTALSSRLEKVITMNRSWESAVTPTVLADTDSCSNIVRGIFLDPPYLIEKRKYGLYQSDVDGSTDEVARASFEWAVEHGEKEGYKIAYCCHEGDFEPPRGWSSEIRTFSGVKKTENKTKRDLIMFSPGCDRIETQSDLFEGVL